MCQSQPALVRGALINFGIVMLRHAKYQYMALVMSTDSAAPSKLPLTARQQQELVALAAALHVRRAARLAATSVTQQQAPADDMGYGCAAPLGRHCHMRNVPM